MCNWCHEIGQLLHEQQCLLCGKANYFYDPGMVVDKQNDAIVKDMLIKLNVYKNKGGSPPSFETVSPRQEAPEIIKPSHDIS